MERKDEHLKLAISFHDETKKSDFDLIDFVHNSLPNTNVDNIDISTSIATFTQSHPFYINGMTGGTELTKNFNQKLAILARETNTIMGVGSLSVALRHKEIEDTFKIVRKENKNGIIFANIGADKSLEEAKKAVHLIDANGIQIHINPAQEIIMPEGERDFTKWIENIENIISNVGVPVIVKEVGFGMSRETIKLLKSIGTKTIDISGKGGTNFGKIENSRRKKDSLAFLEEYGFSTAESLLEAQEFVSNTEIISSGGIRNTYDIVKSLALGAKSTSMAGKFIMLVNDIDIENAIDIVNNWKYQIKSIMALIGANNINELQEKDILIRGKLNEFARLRNIDVQALANRK